VKTSFETCDHLSPFRGWLERLLDKAPLQRSAGDPGRIQRGDRYHRSGTLGERRFSASV